jgi:tetratricopeptide (TPR) repeat protein
LTQSSYPDFSRRLDALPPDPAVAEGLREEAALFSSRAEVIPAFERYQTSALQTASALDQKWCDLTFSEAGLKRADSDLQIFDGEGGMSLREIVCAATRKGHTVSGKRHGLFSGNVSLNIKDPSGEEIPVTLEEERTRSGDKILVGTSIGESSISREDWAAYVQALSEPQVSGLPDGNGVTDCDRLASDPDDPQSIARGINSADIELERALEACVLALEFDPENPRLQYQLGRALYLAGDEEPAIELFDLADKSGYVMASYQLGEMLFLQGLDDAELLDAAHEYYASAAEGGYEAAKESIAQVQEMLSLLRPSFTKEMFKRPNLIKAAYEENFSGVEGARNRLYYMSLFGTYSQICPGELSVNMRARLAFNEFGALVEAFMNIGQDPGGITVIEANEYQAISDAAASDIITLSGYHSCGSERMKTMFVGLEKFLERE